MFQKLEDFNKDWEKLTDATVKLFKNLNDDVLSNKVYPEGRTLGRIIWHVVTVIGEMADKAGLEGNYTPEDAPVPNSVKTIISNFISDAELLKDIVNNRWKNANLSDHIHLFGESWSKGYVLNVIIRHHYYHLGQITVLMRQAGLKVTGIAGPAKEEWSSYGMETPE